jgi:hypothetical protein
MVVAEDSDLSVEYMISRYKAVHMSVLRCLIAMISRSTAANATERET